MVSGTSIKSVLILQIFLYLDIVWTPVYTIVYIIIWVYKGYHFPYPNYSIGWECLFIAFYPFVQAFRIRLGMQGNIAEQTPPMLYFIPLTCGVIFGYVYYLRLQTFVAPIDITMNIIALVIIGPQLLFGIYAAYVFSRYRAVIGM
mmetsp:Transcript_21214/g.35454  ORF Transcript_21214/g.35454 Transcript_21214/m.35454 type:complete len:145 (-) Transcript_21214:221-655(-)